MRLRSPHPLHIALLLGLLRLCSPARQPVYNQPPARHPVHHQNPSRQHRVSRHFHQTRLPVPTSETIALVAAEMGAATYEETVETDDSRRSGRRVQRKLVTGVEDIDGNAEYQEYQGVMGRPGIDFPVLPSIPVTSFSCRSVRAPGYYADLDTDCQVFHICDGGRKISFLCPNGTIFRQSHLICDWWFRVDCGKSVELYDESAEQLAADQRIYKARAEAIAKAMQKVGSSSETGHVEPSRVALLPHSGERSNFRSVSSSSSNEQSFEDYKKNSNSFEHHRKSQRPSHSRSTTSQERENQLPAETASFASNRNNQQYIQNLFYRHSSTTESPRSAHTPSGKAYVELNRSRNGYSTTTSTTTISPFLSNLRRLPQRNGNNHGDNHKTPGSSTSSNIFTVKVKPNKSFSYVELHRTRTTPFDKSHEDAAASNQVSQQPISIATSTENPHPASISPSSQGISVTPHSQIGSSTLGNLQSRTASTVTSLTSDTSQLKINGLGPSNSGHFITVTPSQTTVSPVFGSSAFPTTLNEIYFTTARPFFDLEDDSFHLPDSGFSPVSTIFYDNTVTTTLAPPTVTENYFVYNTSGKAKSLKDIVEGDEISPEAVNSLQYLAEELKNGTRSGINIPDSTGAKALHSLALYFAADSETTTQVPEPVTIKNSKVSDEILLRSHSGSPDDSSELDEAQPTEIADLGKELPSVLTKTTKDSYAYLFPDLNKTTTKDNILSKSKERTPKKEEVKPPLNIKNGVISNDLEQEQSRGIAQPTTKVTMMTTTEDVSDLQLRDSTDLRELAQVFSRALSAYLEDPESFRRVLSEVRPTEPTPANSDGTTLPDENEEEVLDFSDVKSDPKRLYQSSATTVSYQEAATESQFNDNSFNIAEINNLANTASVSPEPSLHLTAPPLPLEPETNYYTTISPVSFAEDVNNFIGLNNDTNIESPDYYTQESFDSFVPGFPTAGGVNDNSRPRFGGFHNNSKVESTTSYSPYGAGVPSNLTGQPLFVPVTKGTSSKPAEMETTSPHPTLFQTTIDIQSIPEHLNVVPPHDVNNLLGSSYFSTVSDSLPLSTVQSPIINSLNHDARDQEKVLITSGSQSLVSRGNYVRFFNNNNNNRDRSRNNHHNKGNINVKTQHNGSSDLRSNYPSSTVKYSQGEKSPIKPNNSINTSLHQSSEQPSSQSEYQAVNLGNGVTIERTKSVRYSTPSSTANDVTWTVSPVIDTINRNYVSTPQVDIRSPTPSSKVRPSPVTIIPTTYHPFTNQPLATQPDAIPPRGHQRINWQWDHDVNKSDNSNYVSPTPSQPSPSVYDFVTFPNPTQPNITVLRDQISVGSTLMPDVSTFINSPENFEKRAREMFGNLNETTANALMEVMHEAESNMTLRRLVLLLVADKNGRENKSIEESRTQLIQALLKNPGEKEHISSNEQSTIIENRRDELMRKGMRGTKTFNGSGRMSSTTSTTTTSEPTTSTQISHNSKSYRGTDSATGNRGSSRQLGDVFPSESDSRAVELLKSLYTLAARWG
ncbi:uncharacterized protein LOC142328318 [Lycorma delicatula]|uniref:uncharacterized protein LOC142328318 n=1 Tax=Lycorma delicatula TaxID=130591 RepID=UPI003F512E7F